MPSKRSLLLGLIGLAVLVGIVLLAIKVTESPAVDVDEAKLEAAQAAYRRGQADRPGAPPQQVPSLQPRAARSAPGQVEPDEGAPDEPPPPQINERRPPQLKLNPATPAEVAHMAKSPEDSLKDQMAQANKFYDRADYESARDEALNVLQDHPRQVRMLRVVVSSSCIMGDHDMAGEYFDKLQSARDRKQMSRRCKRYGVELEP